MEFKSRFARVLPLLALVAALVVPFKPVAAAAKEPYPVAPAAQINAGNLPADSNEDDARLYRPRKPRHSKDALTAAAEDGVLAAGKIRKHDKKALIAAAQDEVLAAGRIRKHDKKALIAAAQDEVSRTRHFRKKA